MFLNADILEFLFATIATIVATMTGLIGAFSTFRLQNIVKEIDLLKDLLLAKKIQGDISFKDYLKNDNYNLLEKIYDLDLKGIETLENVIQTNQLNKQINEVLLFDINNIKRNQRLHDNTKQLTIRGVTISLFFVFISLVLLIFSNGLLLLGERIWVALALYMSAVAYIFHLFIKQLKQLI
jgi:hypothetical protein